jgi:dihydroorotase
MKYDLILRSAHVIDPSQELDGVCDVAIKDGRIAAVGPALEAPPDIPQEELGRVYLAPGLVDLHGHWYEGSAFGIDPDRCASHGVTTVVDAGTTGFINFKEFQRNCIETSRVRVLAFLNIAATGILTPITAELADLRIARPKETAEVLLDHQRDLVGVKVRLGSMSANHALEALDRSLEAAEAAKTRLMVHISKTAPTREILDRLRPGDILTHCFQGRGDGLVSDGCLLPQAIDARERGVVFDVGHGCGSFSWNTAKAAFEHFFYPDTISTDLHRFSIDRWCIDMPTTMSKFLHLGMSLEDVVSKTTWMPARALGRESEIGTLRPGASADLFVFSIEEGQFPLEDTHMKVAVVDRMIRVHCVMRAGRWVNDHDVKPLRKLYDCDYEVFRTLEESA